MRPLTQVIAFLVAAAVLAWMALPQLRPVPRFDLRVETALDDASSFVVRVTAMNAPARAWLHNRQSPATDWAHFLRVHTNQSHEPLFGAFELAESELRFHPSVPPVPGSHVSVTFTDGIRQRPAVYDVPNPERDRITPRVLSIHPSADVLPENLIKFYIEFSTPMTQGDFFQHVKLLDERTFKPVPGAFREVELWSPDGRRFTLWLHPGRQKTGVNLNEDEGPVLRQGSRYTLQIMDTLTARSGMRLSERASKTFTVGPHDSTVPDLKHWRFTAPAKDTRAPLTVAFDKPLDWAMLDSGVWITDAAGLRVKGGGAAVDDERQWRFTPVKPWRAGSYHLNVNPELEDLAGNSLLRSFESPASAAQPVDAPKLPALGFEVKP